MNKTELEAEVERLRVAVLRRDRLLRTCYYRVRQIRDAGQGKLLAEMAEWAPVVDHMRPVVARRTM